MLSIRHLAKSYVPGKPVLNDINLDIAARGITAIIGPSGTGKSTLIRCINRLVEPSAGEIEFEGEDLGGLSSSTPIVVFTHIPLWAVYPQWGWTTQDGEQALGYLRRFGSVTVLNGHIHQIMQKVEGTISFHTARSTAFPQPAPGAAPSPGPLRVPVEALGSMLGVREVAYVQGKSPLAVVDSALGRQGP